MALIGPILDDRTYDQLRDELVRRIPVYTPEWTDHNESDPGIALLELFAHLGESLLFRFNQIPDATKVAFLRLLGVRPRAGRAATVLLAASTDRADGVAVPRGGQVRAGSVVFETDDEVYVWPLAAIGAAKTAVTTGDATDPAPGDADRRADALERLDLAPTTAAQFYDTTLLGQDPGVPIDVAATLDGSLWVALHGEIPVDLAALGGRTLFVGVGFDEVVERPWALHELDETGTAGLQSSGLTSDPPAMSWSLWNGPGAGLTPLVVERDTTRGMVVTGVVTLTLPAVLPSVAGAVTSGDQDSPPPLQDEELAAGVIGWLRVGRPAGTADNDPIHRVRWVGLNAVAATAARTAPAELLGTGTGEPDQTLTLARIPVLPGTARVQVEEPDGWRDWTEVEPAAVSTPDDRHVRIDPADGTVTFGGGGRAPRIGERVRVLGYRHGGGVEGNVAAGAVGGSLGDSGAVTATNPMPAVGGAEPASLADALDEIPGLVHTRDRAVTSDDFRSLAAQVPGVARAECLPLLHPDTPLVSAAGVVTVVVFPDSDTAHPDAPLPDLGLLRRVADHLDVRRLVTTELYVVPPTYREVLVSVGVQVRAGYPVDAVRRWVEQILRQYLRPLPPDGPDGAGWPLGRQVRAAELAAVAVQVEGVEYLNGLRLAVRSAGAPAAGPAPAPGPPVEVDRVVLERWEVPALGGVVAAAGAPPEPGSAAVPPAPASVLVPMPPDVC